MCYWEHKEEIQWANRHQTSTQNSSNKLTSSAPNSAPSSKSNNNNDKKLTNASSSNPELANKLGKDGKLMMAEHKRHYDLKLCIVTNQKLQMISEAEEGQEIAEESDQELLASVTGHALCPYAGRSPVKA
ncbi:hypothetical protein ID866_11806 [Astraeus odoratus]|nr:hypothetical protein ID866_11806 [Astraeus odoratus]